MKMRKEGCANVSPHPRVIGFSHLDGVKRPIEVDHIERDDWVLLASLRSQRRKWRETRKRNQSVQPVTSPSDKQDWRRWRTLLTFG